MNERPNLFEFATSELSQDAFIAWIAQWADEKYKDADEKLHKIGQKFIKHLIKMQYPDFNDSIKTVLIKKQWENIDIAIDVNSNEVQKYFIVIEDKTYSGEHSKQLESYKKVATNYAESNGYNVPVCIYLKTGDDTIANKKKIEEKGYSYLNRSDFFGLLKENNISNDIYRDYLSRLEKIEESRQLSSEKIDDWGLDNWISFYKYLDEYTAEDGDDNFYLEGWGYVPNGAGGIFYADLPWKKFNDDLSFYIHIEENILQIRLATNFLDKTCQSSLRTEAFDFMIKKANDFYKVSKPKRIRSGKTMCVAVVLTEDWLGDTSKPLKIDKVILNLKKYYSFLCEFMEEYKNQ